MTIFDVNMSFWLGMGIVVGITIAYVIVCWVIPPKKKKKREVTVSNEQ